MRMVIGAAFCFCVIGSSFAGHVEDVDVFIGTAGSGHTTPAACVPFGMIQAGPDTGIGDWDHCSGYQYGDTDILGFSQTHLSGTGCPDLGDVSIMPFVGSFDGNTKNRFKKSDEKAGPGWYATRLERGDIAVSIAASDRTAFYSFTFTNEECRLHVNLPFAIHYPQNPGWARCKWFRSSAMIRDERTLTGFYEREVWNRRRVGFAIRFDRPFAEVKEFKSGECPTPSSWVFDFAIPIGTQLKVRIALSTGEGDAALENLEAEGISWDLDEVRKSAAAKWEGVLSRVEAEGSRDAVTKFYTALYHACVHPNDISDVGKRPFYSTFSCWDTYRAVHPLYTLLLPERVPDMVDSLLEQGKRTGYLPIWSLWGTENQCMIGTHSVPVIVDAYMKGAWGGEPEKAYAQIKDTLTRKHEGREKENWDILDTYGCYPFDFIKGESVSRTMECAYDDWCAGKMAEKLGHMEDAAFFYKRSTFWKNVFDSDLGLVRGKDSRGCWRREFDPSALGHGAERENDFTEGNAFQYTWHVQQDPDALIAAFGGRARFNEKLEAIFHGRVNDDSLKGNHDVSGLIGQYAHGNEPSHHVPYFFSLIGRHGRTAELVRQICKSQYGTSADGLCGNDDCGQMSAWYLFSAMGFYPFNPCGGEYVLGAPQLDRISLRMRNGTAFTVVAHNLSDENLCVKSVSLNGRPLDGFILKHADILKGGELVCEMGSSSDVAPKSPRNKSIRVGSYNIRNMKDDRGTANDWDARKSALVGLLRRLDLDVFGLQEVYPEQLDYIRCHMPEYEFVGEFRNADRKSGEASPACWRRDRFDVLDKGTFWLSETPDIPGSKSWDTACTRVCSYLILRDRKTSKKFCVANTHTDHRSVEAREKGMELILERLSRYGGGAPIIFVGDHNCEYESVPARAVRRVLNDARDISQIKDPGPLNTFHRWGSITNDPNWRIDYIYVSKGIRVFDFVTHDERRLERTLYPSDHYPISATILIEGATK